MPLHQNYIEDKVICHCANGQTIETTIKRAAEIDQIEGTAVIHVSATMFKALYDRIAELEKELGKAGGVQA